MNKNLLTYFIDFLGSFYDNPFLPVAAQNGRTIFVQSPEGCCGKKATPDNIMTSVGDKQYPGKTLFSELSSQEHYVST